MPNDDPPPVNMAFELLSDEPAPPFIVSDWRSLKNHGTAAAPNWQAIPCRQDKKPGGEGPAGTFHNMETRINGIKNLECTFSEPINLPLTTDIVACGCTTGPYNPDTVSLDGTGTILTMKWSGIPNGQTGGPPDAYLFVINNVTDLAGNPLAGDNDVEIWAQYGNVKIKPVVPYRANTDDFDLTDLSINYTAGPVTANNCMYDIVFTSGSKNKIDDFDLTGLSTYYSTMPCDAPPATCP